MQTIEYRFIDKSGLPQGQWSDEPDKKQWQDAATGLPCLLRRNHHMGNLCGYVGVPPGHPFHGKDYADLPDIEVHGGLTYSDACQEGDPEHGICHRPEPGEPDHVWWFGFDCGHAWDVMPFYDFGYSAHGGQYRDQAYVEAQCAELAQQLAAAGQPK